jgi:hypothetical protein
VTPGIVAVEVSTTGVFFHGLPRIRELEVAGRPWQPKKRRAKRGAGCGCLAAPSADGDGALNAPRPAAASPGAAAAAAAAADAAPSAHHLVAELQQPVVLPAQPVLEAGALPDDEEAGAAGSEVFLYVHGLGEDFGNGHVRLFGQMVALLELPPHISPLLFCWPAGIVRGCGGARGGGRCGRRPPPARERAGRAGRGVHGGRVP